MFCHIRTTGHPLSRGGSNVTHVLCTSLAANTHAPVYVTHATSLCRRQRQTDASTFYEIRRWSSERAGSQHALSPPGGLYVFISAAAIASCAVRVRSSLNGNSRLGSSRNWISICGSTLTTSRGLATGNVVAIAAFTDRRLVSGHSGQTDKRFWEIHNV